MGNDKPRAFSPPPTALFSTLNDPSLRLKRSPSTQPYPDISQKKLSEIQNSIEFSKQFLDNFSMLNLNLQANFSSNFVSRKPELAFLTSTFIPKEAQILMERIPKKEKGRSPRLSSKNKLVYKELPFNSTALQEEQRQRERPLEKIAKPRNIPVSIPPDSQVFSFSTKEKKKEESLDDHIRNVSLKNQSKRISFYQENSNLMDSRVEKMVAGGSPTQANSPARPSFFVSKPVPSVIPRGSVAAQQPIVSSSLSKPFPAHNFTIDCSTQAQKIASFRSPQAKMNVQPYSLNNLLSPKSNKQLFQNLKGSNEKVEDPSSSTKQSSRQNDSKEGSKAALGNSFGSKQKIPFDLSKGLGRMRGF